MQAIPDRFRPFVAGGLAGAAEVVTTMPFEVTKNRMQLAGASRSQSILSSMAHTVAVAGPAGLYYGLQAQMVQVCGKSAIRFAVYDLIQKAVPGQPLVCGAPFNEIPLLRAAHLEFA
jgi:hypothetical protein